MCGGSLLSAAPSSSSSSRGPTSPWSIGSHQAASTVHVAPLPRIWPSAAPLPLRRHHRCLGRGRAAAGGSTGGAELPRRRGYCGWASRPAGDVVAGATSRSIANGRIGTPRRAVVAPLHRRRRRTAAPWGLRPSPPALSPPTAGPPCGRSRGAARTRTRHHRPHLVGPLASSPFSARG